MKTKRQKVERSARLDDGNAFLPDITGGKLGLTSSAADAEFFGEEFIGSATTGESVSLDMRDEVVDEEEGGPFLVLGEDGSLPSDSEDRSMDIEGHEPVMQAQTLRGARWAARGA